MKKRNITLCAVAMLCMQGYAKADTFILKGDNTCVENYAQMTAAYKSNRPKMKKDWIKRDSSCVYHFTGSTFRY